MRKRRVVVFALLLPFAVAFCILIYIHATPLHEWTNIDDPSATAYLKGREETEPTNIKAKSAETNTFSSSVQPSGSLPESASKTSSLEESGNRFHNAPIIQRLTAYSNALDDLEAPPQECVHKYLRESDLPDIYRFLDGHHDSNGYLNLLYAVCILESDSGKAILAVLNHINRPVDWKSFLGNMQAYNDWRYRYTAVAALGFLNSDKARDHLVSLLSADEARAIVLNSAGPKGNWILHKESVEERNALESLGSDPDLVWIEQGVLNLRAGAALGLMFTGNATLFKHVENAYRDARSIHVDDRTVFDQDWEYALLDSIERFRFFNDKGWNEGYRILSGMSWESKLVLLDSYHPDP